MPTPPEPRTWWLSPAPGEELSGPYTEAECRDRWIAGREMWPQQGVWTGLDPRHVQPAPRAAWLTVRPSLAGDEGAASMTNAELADALLGLPGVRPAYRDAVLAEAAARLRPVPVEELRTIHGEPMFDEPTRAYLRALRLAGPADWAPWATYLCTECGTHPDGPDGLVVTSDGEPHVLIGGYVVLGCEGYFQVDPEVLGLDRGGWQDWRGDYPEAILNDYHDPGLTRRPARSAREVILDHAAAEAEAERIHDTEDCGHPFGEHDDNGCGHPLPREDWCETAADPTVYCPCTVTREELHASIA